MSDTEDKPLLRRECDRCVARMEVANVKAWVSKIDNRMWLVLVGLVGNLLATLLK